MRSGSKENRKPSVYQKSPTTTGKVGGFSPAVDSMPPAVAAYPPASSTYGADGARVPAGQVGRGAVVTVHRPTPPATGQSGAATTRYDGPPSDPVPATMPMASVAGAG